ncbi:3-oxoacyl-[acyl-carrier-protein] reductase [Cohnella sp. OV330]|uniref:SDR family NAD(P)-dependent oxidoreductase n=1 Tax=Cohnella sp. OV330 TaxID=1855288 RepID=UPI0008EA33FB|nr:3-oxoacyl-ACP reductase family protein [Cohnella sp. OV330]SFB39160.1 3-oxoacyl-[acyl-carrier-protein] reductase [Cohnella sp. OV330]
MRLANKVALVTGGSTGIGEAVCLAFGAEGARVAVNYPSDAARAEDVAGRIRAAGGEAMAVQADVSNSDQVEAMFREIGETWGGADIVVNNAGIYPRRAWHEISEAEWDRVLAVNLKSCFLTSKAAFPHMRSRGYGKIINVASVAFLRGQGGFAHYVASKGGVIGFTRALSREVGQFGIAVNAVSPGAVMTEQELADLPDPVAQESLRAYLDREQAIPGRLLPRDVAGCFLFLASGDSDHMTGQTLNVDGGWAMH